MEFSLAQIQAAISAKFDGTRGEARASGWSIDSRTTEAGDLFFALKGENFDGHDFVAAILKKGAVAAVVSQPVAAIGNMLRVPDTQEALQHLAHWARKEWARPIVAVTGSAGKTSTKDIISALLSIGLTTGKTVGNFNNHIGLPLSILRIPNAADVAVLEMGMNHGGEIRKLCEIAEPEVGVVTNVGYAHVENFESIDGVAAAKRELIEALPVSGTAVLNADDSRVAAFAKAHGGRSITYGLEGGDVRAEKISLTPSGAEFTVATTQFRTQLSGRHNISNILAGIAVAGLFGIATERLPDAVAALAPGKMRGERHVWNGISVLNDSYNSNPEAVRHMLDVLRNEAAARRIAVLGEMRELGSASDTLHREVGAYAARTGVDLLIGIRGTAIAMVEEAAALGMTSGQAMFFETPQEAGEFLKQFVQAGDTILFKGSRGTQVELALATMEAQP